MGANDVIITEPGQVAVDTPVALAPFNTWTYEDVIREVNNAKLPDYDVRYLYCVKKDHFQKGKEWVGPGDAEVNTTIEKQFAPEDAIGEVLANVSNAFSEPQVGVAPIVPTPEGATVSPTVAALMQEAEGLLTDWWDEQNLQEHIMSRLRTSAWAGRAGLRLWVPARFMVRGADGVVRFRPAATMAEALSYIKVVAPAPHEAMILTDPNTQERVAVYLDEEVVWGTDGTAKETFKRAELIYLDPARTVDVSAYTIIRQVYSDPKRQSTKALLPLGGYLLFAEMVADNLITEPVMRMQRQLNMMNTLVTRMGETAAFRERYIINARPQGIRYPYTEGDTLYDNAFLETDDENRTWQVVPTERSLGAHTTTELVGLPQSNDRGDTKTYATPSVVFADPVDPKPYLEATEASRRKILRMAAQGHLGGISNAEASGIAYEQARSVFAKDLNKRRIAEEGMLRYTLSGLLALAEVICGQQGKYTRQLRTTVDQHVNPGPRSPDLVRLDMESYDHGLLSDDTAMSRLGVEDVVAEKGRIRQSLSYFLRILEKTAAEYTPESIKQMLIKIGVPQSVISVLQEKKEPVKPTVPPAR
jgi:hypothetical protein